MVMILSAARTIVSDHLDDSQNDRWSNSQIDSALTYALDACINEYVAYGGDRLSEIQTLSTDTSGLIDLSSFDPQRLMGVGLVIGTRVFPITEVDYENRGLNDGQPRSLQIRLMRTFTLPTDPANPLVGNGATTVKSWSALEHWICVRAALFCSIKDGEMRPELQRIEREMSATVLQKPTIPRATAFPDRPHWYSNWFSWCWVPNTQKLQLARKGWF